MAYFNDSADLQSKVRDIQHITWKNDITRLNATNLNKVSMAAKTLSQILCDTSNSDRGLIQQFDAVRQLVQGRSTPDYSIKSYYAQLEMINRSLYGYRSGDIDYQLGDAPAGATEEVEEINSYFRIDSPKSTYNETSGVLGKMYWKYINQDKPFVDDYSNFRNVYRCGVFINPTSTAEDPNREHTAFDNKSGISLYPYGIISPSDITTPFELRWDSIIFNGNLKVDAEGNIVPLQTNTLSVGGEQNIFNYGWFTNLNSTNNTFKNLKPAQEDGSYIGTQLIPYQNLYVRNGHIEFLNSKNINVLSVLPITLNGTLQESNIGGDTQRHNWGYFNNLKVTNQGADSDSVVQVGDLSTSELEWTDESGNTLTPTLTNATKALFGKSTDTLYVVNDAGVEIEDADGNRTLDDKTTYALINYTTKIDRNVAIIAGGNLIVTDPSFSWGDSDDSGSTDDNNIKAYEVGRTITPTYEIKYGKGSYEFGYIDTDATGAYIIENGAYKTVTNNGVGATPSYNVIFNGETKITAKGSFSAVYVTDDTSLSCVATCNYSDGQMPISSIGLPVENKKVSSKSQELTSKTLTGYRRAFVGGTADKSVNPATYSSTAIRNLTTRAYTSKSFEFSINSEAQRVVIAFPDKWGSLTAVFDKNDSNKNIYTAFGEPVIVSVDGYTAGKDTLDYKLYVMDFASEYGAEGNTYSVQIG